MDALLKEDTLTKFFDTFIPLDQAATDRGDHGWSFEVSIDFHEGEGGVGASFSYTGFLAPGAIKEIIAFLESHTLCDPSQTMVFFENLDREDPVVDDFFSPVQIPFDAS